MTPFEIEKLIDQKVLTVQPVSGGDINEAFKVDTVKGSFFLKYNRANQASKMFAAEVDGLRALKDTNGIRIPKIFQEGNDFLLLEWIDAKPATKSSWQHLGEQLSDLHRHTNDSFGWKNSNYIGSLVQPNKPSVDWTTFYIEQRILPFFKNARDNGFFSQNDTQHIESLCKKLSDLLPEEPPSLIHGDMWSGNFLFDQRSCPVLIDPAVSFAHREMDIAMTKLFGGFSAIFYQSYDNSFPLLPNFDERLPVYQLYYLLVHVVLFGNSYVGSVRRILNQYI